MTSTTCPITGEPARMSARGDDYQEFDCPRCGVFRISTAAMVLAGGNRDLLANALAVAKTSSDGAGVPTIDNVVSG